MIMNMFMFKAAIFLMLLMILREVLRKRFNIDMDKIDITKFNSLKKQIPNRQSVRKDPKSNKNPNLKALVLKNPGTNKATVMATLRQITGMDYVSAKNLVDSVPATILSNVSEKEALLTKKALEFVGAELEIS